MASDDQANPYEQPSPWPRLRQGPMRLGLLPTAKLSPPPAPPAPEPEPPPAPVRDISRPNASIFTGAATPLRQAPAPAGLIRETPIPEAPAEITVRTREPDSAPAWTPPDLTEADLAIPVEGADLAIPAPEAEALVIPFAPQRTRARARKPSRLVPFLAATAVGVAGVGVLAFLMNAGQRAATPIPAAPAAPAQAIAIAPATPTPEPAAAPIGASAPALSPAPAARPTPQRLAAARTRLPAPTPTAAAPEPLPLPEPVAAEAPPPRITIPPPTPEPAPAPAPASRVHSTDPEAPISTHTPE